MCFPSLACIHIQMNFEWRRIPTRVNRIFFSISFFLTDKSLSFFQFYTARDAPYAKKRTHLNHIQMTRHHHNGHHHEHTRTAVENGPPLLTWVWTILESHSKLLSCQEDSTIYIHTNEKIVLILVTQYNFLTKER